MRNAMQLKSKINSIAKSKGVRPQLILQNYMMERFLERVSLSRYCNNFIIKGGFLIASIVGLDTRATMDMDATIKGYPASRQDIEKMVIDIAAIKVDDNITFIVKNIVDIRKFEEYGGYRLALTANYDKMAVPLKLDITTGDKITPREVEYDYKLMLDDRSIRVWAYNMPTILAEKLESVLSRSVQNTRLRDFYDIYILTKVQMKNIDLAVLRDALDATAQKRGSIAAIKNYEEIMSSVKESNTMVSRWNIYRKDFGYAKEIEFVEVCHAVLDIMKHISS